MPEVINSALARAVTEKSMGFFLPECRRLRGAHLDAVLAFAEVSSLYAD
jgi:hypothetical protein